MVDGLLRDYNMKKSKFSIKIKDIALIVYDFDGVMTDNRVIVFQDGTEAVTVNRSDGLGVECFRNFGVPQLILSTETNLVVKKRGEKLCLEVISSCKDKKKTLETYCMRKSYDLNKVIYVGNDLNDMEVMKIVGFPIAPADSHPRIKRMAKLITKTKGGEGVVRELLDYIVHNNG